MNRQIILLFLMNIVTAVGYSLISTLFPPIAIKKGLNESHIGLIISLFSFSHSLIIPFSQKIFNVYGKRKIFFISLLSEVNKI